jgi:hypothetical protein
MSKLYPSISGLSILMALALAVGEWYFFSTEERGKVHLGFFHRVASASIWPG